jgi:hypothetical protein
MGGIVPLLSLRTVTTPPSKRDPPSSFCVCPTDLFLRLLPLALSQDVLQEPVVLRLSSSPKATCYWDSNP